MKEFAVYTGLRLALLAAAWALVSGIWLLFTEDRLPILLPLVIAFVISGVASYFLLNRQRDAFARRIQARADRAAARFEDRRGREDGGA
ncbi:hypothetical protein GCM10009737_24890 [Nocardioides lentus]|uniref:DUF4229 domain-containing protein n=1 Tax=Nocardioides lentus TaxID=338077 RepID=A0ABN2PLB7_9ACTN